MNEEDVNFIASIGQPLLNISTDYPKKRAVLVLLSYNNMYTKSRQKRRDVADVNENISQDLTTLLALVQDNNSLRKCTSGDIAGTSILDANKCHELTREVKDIHLAYKSLFEQVINASILESGLYDLQSGWDDTILRCIIHLTQQSGWEFYNFQEKNGQNFHALPVPVPPCPLLRPTPRLCIVRVTAGTRHTLYYFS